MANSFNSEAAKGYREAAISVQKLDGKTVFKQMSVPKLETPS